MSAPRRPTLRDIAERTGFSKATVSLALRNSPEIAAATRTLIQDEARILSYRPDPALAMIAAHRWDSVHHSSGAMLAAVIPFRRGRSPFVGEQIAVGAEHARGLGHGFDTFYVEDYPSMERMGEVLFHRGVRGVILAHNLYDPAVEGLPWHHFSIVSLNYCRGANPFHEVRDNIAGHVDEAWRHLSARGVERVGVIGLPASESSYDTAFVSAVAGKQVKLPVHERQSIQTMGALWSESLMRGWLERYRIQAVVGFSDRVLAHLHQCGIAVPGEVAFASLGADPSGPSAGLLSCGNECSVAAVDLLDLLIRKNERGIPEFRRVVNITAPWKEGSTLERSP